jgi:hypothetical protein
LKTKDLTPFEPTKVGTYCLYLRGKNSMLYRAHVKHLSPDSPTLEVVCVDYGISTAVGPGDKLYVIPESLCDVKIQAIK